MVDDRLDEEEKDGEESGEGEVERKRAVEDADVVEAGTVDGGELREKGDNGLGLEVLLVDDELVRLGRQDVLVFDDFLLFFAIFSGFFCVFTV